MTMGLDMLAEQQYQRHAKLVMEELDQWPGWKKRAAGLEQDAGDEALDAWYLFLRRHGFQVETATRRSENQLPLIAVAVDEGKDLWETAMRLRQVVGHWHRIDIVLPSCKYRDRIHFHPQCETVISKPSGEKHV